MTSGQLAGGSLPAPMSAAPSAVPSVAGSRAAPGPLSLAVSFLVGTATVLLLGAANDALSWAILVWIVGGVAAGICAPTMKYAWVALPIVGAFYFITNRLGWAVDDGPFWVIGAVVGVGLVAAGFATGTLIAWRRSPVTAFRGWWGGLSRAWRVAATAVVVLGVVVVVGYTGFIASVGSDGFVNPATGSTACATPASAFGWEYEAINYDKADDAALAAANPDMTACSSQGAQAGTAVVASDGVQVAGWYIPAASGIGPDGPTLVIVPGFNSNKSDILEFAPPFHEDYNLVLADLRNQGRSSPADVTLGLHEQRDVEAILDWLVATKQPGSIAAMGNSMGAATLLAEARTDPRIEAFILDSMHANFDVMLGHALETDYGYPSVPAAWAIRTAVDGRIKGDVRSIDPVTTITQIGDRPVLLLHSTTDRIDPPAEAAERNQHAALDAGVPVELQYCVGETTGNGSHGHVIDRCPDDWSRWANQFLEAALAD
jgi:pimeloyl-ACP methyl ester carboxylesterase